MQTFKGKTVVVTGGTTGIGAAAARMFHEQGARVLVTGRNPETLEAARRALPDGVIVVRSDAASVADIDALATTVRDQLGGIDALFVNAGTARVAPLAAVTEALFDEMVALNVKGPLFTVQRLRPLLRDKAAVVINTSVAGHWQIAGTSVYAATKGALRALVRTLAAELAPDGIRVNAVCPGLIETPIFGKIGLGKDALAALAVDLVGKTPAGRTGSPDEVARAALWLASPDASFVIGEELIVDGGMMMR